MGSVIVAAIFTIAAIVSGVLATSRVAAAISRWNTRRSNTPVAVRWLWTIIIVCMVLTCAMMVMMSWYQVLFRGMEGAVEGSLSARIAFYTGISAYGFAWLAGKVRVTWPSHRETGPKLLPPAPDDVVKDDSDSDPEQH